MQEVRFIKFKNISDKVLKNQDLGIRVPPGGTVDIEEGYALPGRTPGGKRRPSVIENLCPKLVPADDKFRAAWEKAPVANPRRAKASKLRLDDEG